MAYKISEFRFVPYVYRWSKEIDPLLPNHYKQRCKEFMEAEPLSVHWRPDPRKFTVHPKTGERQRVQNVPVKVIYPIESNNALWGGEGIIVGRRKKKHYSVKTPQLWLPFLTKRALYSEIFDKFYLVTVTLRTLDLIDQCYGFDSYILGTNEANLNSELAMKFKRDMLIALAEQSFQEGKPEIQSKILQKYEKYMLPLEEAEWIGLPSKLACQKAIQLHKELNPVRPMKELFIEELSKKSDGEDMEGLHKKQSWLGRMNIFGKSEETKS